MGTMMSEMMVWINGQPVSASAAALHIDVEQIDVTSFAYVPDPDWRFVDAAGHFHAWSFDGERASLPTLVQREVWTAFDEPDEETGEAGYSVPHWYCAICDEEIKPGHRPPDPGPKVVPGRKSWRVEVAAIVPERGPVSVRIESGGRVLFGLAQAGGEAIVRSDGTGESTLYGIGELGQMKRQLAQVTP